METWYTTRQIERFQDLHHSSQEKSYDKKVSFCAQEVCCWKSSGEGGFERDTIWYSADKTNWKLRNDPDLLSQHLFFLPFQNFPIHIVIFPVTLSTLIHDWLDTWCIFGINSIAVCNISLTWFLPHASFKTVGYGTSFVLPLPPYRKDKGIYQSLVSKYLECCFLLQRFFIESKGLDRCYAKTLPLILADQSDWNATCTQSIVQPNCQCSQSTKTTISDNVSWRDGKKENILC